MELLMRYFVGTEIGVCNLLQRHFDWASNSLWFEEIPSPHDVKKTLFCLGEKDEILCAQVSMIVAVFSSPCTYEARSVSKNI
jgi:hypothetical protein